MFTETGEKLNNKVVSQLNRWNKSVAAKLKVISDNFLRYSHYFENSNKDVSEHLNISEKPETLITFINSNDFKLHNRSNKQVFLNNIEEITDKLKSEFLKAREVLSNWKFFLPLVQELKSIEKNNQTECENKNKKVLRLASFENCNVLPSVIKRNRQLERKKSRQVSRPFLFA